MSTPTLKINNSLSSSVDTVYWNNAGKCFDGDMSVVKLIVTTSTLYLPIQYINNNICIFNDSSSSIDVFLPISNTGYISTGIPVASKKILNVQYLFNSFPQQIATQ